MNAQITVLFCDRDKACWRSGKHLMKAVDMSEGPPRYYMCEPHSNVWHRVAHDCEQVIEFTLWRIVTGRIGSSLS